MSQKTPSPYQDKVQKIEEELSFLLDVEQAILDKKSKIDKRQSIVKEFSKQADENMSFLNWSQENLRKEDLDLIRGIGYFYGDIDYNDDFEIAISNDGENEAIDIPMVFSKVHGFYVPLYQIVGRALGSELEKDGYVLGKTKKAYYPSTDDAKELNDDILGGYSKEEIMMMDRISVQDYLDALDVESDYFEERLDEVDSIIQQLLSTMDKDTDFSNAFGDKWRNWQRKRAEKAKIRREERENAKDENAIRKVARRQKRAEKKDCKNAYKSGDIDKDEYNICKRTAAAEKRKTLIEEGGGLFATRVGRRFLHADPFTATARGSFLAILKMNVFGAATRFAPLFIDSPKFDPQYTKDIRSKKTQIVRAWRNMGGLEAKLEWAIKVGYLKTPKLTTQKARTLIQDALADEEPTSNVAGYDDAVIAAIIGAGTTVLATLMKIIGDAVKNKKAFKATQTPSNLQNVQYPTQNELDQLVPPEFRGMRVAQDGKIYDANGQQVKSNTILGINKIVFFVSAGLLTLLLLALIFIPKKGK